MGRWAEINSRIRECRSRPNPEPCLRTLYEETKDGMAALALGEELEKLSRLEEALDFFVRAERLFPKEEYKEAARAAIARVRARTAVPGQRTVGSPGADEKPTEFKDTLYVISCTKTKIWDQEPDAPKYVSARDAYRGHTIKEWLQSEQYRQAQYWVILSARYGFIEPDQPISNYDVTFAKDETGPLSLDSLRAQVESHRYGKTRWRLADFRRVEVSGGELYHKIVCAAFMRTPAQIVRNDRFGD